MIFCFCIDLANGIEPVKNLEHKKFPGKISIQKQKRAVSDLQKNKSDLTLWLVKSQLILAKESVAII